MATKIYWHHQQHSSRQLEIESLIISYLKIKKLIKYQIIVIVMMIKLICGYYINHINVSFSLTTMHIINCYGVVRGCIFPNKKWKMQLNQCPSIALDLLSYISTFLANNFGRSLHHCVLLFWKAPTIEHAPFYNACHSHPWQHHYALFPSILGMFQNLMGKQE